MLPNAYGRFDSSGRTYAISDHRTPTPWTNVVCNGRYGFVVSQNGGGFSWLDNSQLNVLTRWDMDLIRDDRGKFLYVTDLDSNEVWSLSPAPCFPTYDEYRCEHTQGSTTFRTLHRGIQATWTMAVAPGDAVEVWRVEIANATQRERRLRVASFFEWCLGAAPDVKREFHRLFITTRHDAARQAIVAIKNMWDIPGGTERDHWNKPWPYAAAHSVLGAFERPLATADKEAFLGRYGLQQNPAAMTGEERVLGGFGRFVDGAAALGGDLKLRAGQTTVLYFFLAVGANEPEVESLIDRYRSAGAADAAISGASAFWENLLAPTNVETESPDFDLLNNFWLPYQAISGRIWARTGYYQQSGAYGFRDQLQDSQVWLPLDPARCRQQMLLHAAHQFANGSVYHWWHPLAEWGSRTQCSDDYLWLPFIAANYIKETDDWSVLDAAAPFVDDRAPATIFEHCRRSFARAFSRMSPRGLPHIGSCDWNDGLSAVGIEEKGESVWLALFLAGILGDWVHICQKRGDTAHARDFGARRDALLAAINEHAWNGSYFRGATLDSGGWIGDSTCEAGKIFLNCQTWAILNNSATEERLASSWNAVRKDLLAEMGPLLLHPAYSVPDPDIGYITRYSPGSRENGGVYMHAATWALAAAACRKDQASLQKIWKSISPPTRGQNAELYRAEPYVTPGNVDGPLSDTPGKAGWTWYTGSAAWLNRVSLEWILGLRATWEGLLIDPCPFPELGLVQATRTWRGTPIRVRFDAKNYVAGQAPLVKINGAALSGNLLRPADVPRSGQVEIEVSWNGPRSTMSPVSTSGKEVRS
jgi:cellobiose phosphorylase